MLLFSTAVLQLDAMRRGAELREGVARFEALLRYGRAEAALRGQRVQMAIHLSGNDDLEREAEEHPDLVEFSVESDPLNVPGRFLSLPSTRWAIRRPDELIWIQKVRLEDSPLFPAETETDSESLSYPETAAGSDDSISRSDQTFRLTFDPEGATQSVKFLVRSTDPADLRAMLVEVNGFGGRVSHRLLDEEALQEWLEEGSAGGAGGEPAGAALVVDQSR